MAGNHRRPCNVPSHPFSFGVPKEVTDILAVGLESQESDCTRAPRTRDPIIGEATFPCPGCNRTRHLDFRFPSDADVGKMYYVGLYTRNDYFGDRRWCALDAMVRVENINAAW